ncbi:MAG: penicillin acylase family protein, partial [Panacagrimonas sp.]
MAPTTLAHRLAAFPLDGLALRRSVRIRWNTHAVPYIEAHDDADAAYALGLVHVHLRCAQLHMLKRLAQGRVAEMLGPFAVELDHALRLLDLSGAAARCETALATDTRAWLEPFVHGLNDAQARLRTMPPEFRWLGLKAEPWTITDLLTLGRLAGADVNWTHHLGLLGVRGRADFGALWERLRIVGGTAGAAGFVRALTQVVRAGSNSVAIAGSRSSRGAPLMANDPHLGQHLPNFWMLVGLRCPRYHMVGLMPPGLPFVGVGAGAHAAWGGTNMRAASSDLVDVSSLPESEIDVASIAIRVRGLGTRTRTVRRTRFGPILNDASLLKVRGAPVALRWMGSEVSDEIGAFLRASNATTPDAFRAAFATFGVCAQNILFATRDGHIGHVYAGHLPRRGELKAASPVLDPAEADAAWSTRWDATSLPMTVDPECGYRVSANDRPQFAEAPLGFFFSEGDRAARLAQLAARDQLDLSVLRDLQSDTLVPGAARLANALADRLDHARIDAPLAARLRGWDGDYAADAAMPSV